MSFSAQHYRGPDRSVRMTFRYEGGDLHLVRRREIDAIAPPSHEFVERNAPERSGFWVEVHDREGRTLYRRGLHDPIRRRAEVPDGRGGFTSTVSVAPSATFSVLLPNLPEAADVAVFASPLETPHVPEPAREVVRVPWRHEPDREHDGKY